MQCDISVCVLELGILLNHQGYWYVYYLHRKRYLFWKHEPCVSHKPNISGMNMTVSTFDDFTCVKKCVIWYAFSLVIWYKGYAKGIDEYVYAYF